MIVVDTSAWIDYFNRPDSPVALKLDAALNDELVVIGDLVYCEIMQGIAGAKQRRRVGALLDCLHRAEMGGFALAAEAAAHFRTLRTLGVTVRKTIDCLIATYCLRSDLALLHHDRDFDAFAMRLGLRVV